MSNEEIPEILVDLMSAFLTGGQTAVAIHGIEALFGLGVVVWRHGTQQLQLAPHSEVRLIDDEGPEHFVSMLKHEIGGASETIGSDWLFWYVAGSGSLEIANLLARLLKKFDPLTYHLPLEEVRALRELGKKRLRQLELFLQLQHMESMSIEQAMQLIKEIHSYNPVERDEGVVAIGNELEMKLRRLLE